MGRVLGVDVGTRRTGLALSDSAQITCSPYGVLVEPDQETLAREIVRVAQEEQAELVVVGVPRPLRCERNQQSEAVLRLVDRLRALSVTPVVTWDERFTTKLAKRLPSRAGQLDAVAAAFMLQDYLDAARSKLQEETGGAES